MIDTPITTAKALSLSIARPLALVLVLALTGAAHAASLDKSIITSPTPPPAKALDDFYGETVAALKSNDAKKQQQARDDIVNQLLTKEAQPSAAFLFSYTLAANTHLLPLTKDPNVRVRLNAAIAIARLAEKSNNEQLSPVIRALLEDKSDAVALWGVKAAGFILKRDASLVPVMVATAKRSPAVVSATYRALTGDQPSPAAIGALHDLLDARVAAYAKGIPPDPLAEFFAVPRLVEKAWWDAQSPAQRIRTAQLLANLAGSIAQRAASIDVNNNELRESFSRMTKQIGQGIMAIGFIDPSKAFLSAEMKEVANLPTLATPQQIATAAAKAYPALKKAFPGLAAPPNIAATQPAAATDRVKKP